MSHDALCPARVGKKCCCTMTSQGVMQLDTSQLGPIKVDPKSDAEKARIVREAIDSIVADSPYLSEFWIAIAAREYDSVLLKLKRLLK